MDIIYNKIFLEHDTGMHPENKKRLMVCDGLSESRLVNGEPYLNLVHDEAYINHIKLFCQKGGHLDGDTVVSEKSYETAIYAVGATIAAAESGGFALVRPPGHHAHPGQSSGFCIFNNVAIAVAHLLKKKKRVLILDFDGHLGDGTEKIFYANGQVLYWSLHQYPAFPYWGTEDQIGEGRGKGFTVNVPLPPGSGDDVFFEAFDLLIPVAEQFAPDVVAVSAGFDAHQYDLLLDLHLSANAFYRIGKTLREKFSNIFATLEGGYNIEMFPRCLKNFIRGINGERIFYEETATDSTIQVVNEFQLRLGALEKNLAPYWKL